MDQQSQIWYFSQAGAGQSDMLLLRGESDRQVSPFERFMIFNLEGCSIQPHNICLHVLGSGVCKKPPGLF